MTRRRLPPDTRPSWRDPEMPVLVQMADTNQLEPFSAQEVTEWMKVKFAENDEPYWRNDPTYDLKKQRKRL